MTDPWDLASDDPGVWLVHADRLDESGHSDEARAIRVLLSPLVRTVWAVRGSRSYGVSLVRRIRGDLVLPGLSRCAAVSWMTGGDRVRTIVFGRPHPFVTAIDRACRERQARVHWTEVTQGGLFADQDRGSS